MPTSGSSCTSDATFEGPGRGHLGGLLRLTHPFPSLLNGLATGAIALLAGGGAATALRLGGAMLALQASIGATNDVFDADLDRDRKPGKPLPRGVVDRDEALIVAVVGLVLGLALALPSGLTTVAVGAVGAGLGYLYDARLSRTAWSWLPLAIALPLLPVFAWLGATGALPPGLIVLVPAAVLAGTGLALGNALADLDRDREAGVDTVAVRLGRGAAWIVELGCFAGVLLVAWAAAPRPSDPLAAAGWLAAAGGGAAVLLLGAVLGAAPMATLRERGWELEALGIAAIGLAWLAGLAAG